MLDYNVTVFTLPGLAALRGATISGEVYAWIIVFVLPINSAINPILYTFAAQNPIKVCNVVSGNYIQPAVSFGNKWCDKLKKA